MTENSQEKETRMIEKRKIKEWRKRGENAETTQ